MRYHGAEDFIRDLALFDEVMGDWRRYRETVSLRQLLENRDTRNMVLYSMLITFQSVVRCSHHVIIKNYLPKPGTYEETFLILRKAGLLESSFADKLAGLVTYRQALVNSPQGVDLREIYEVLSNDLQVLELYRVKLEALMKDEE
ncbi:type VII toxin-antitoxin system HepT family RNase toxin [Dethiobacter alkaliphilus]|uniref:type VII toxin-antitoxin system HepT family RNase toxin n=1 Tax=Dethiobacter alkaliphilus TaxID=427926 RepID=UPI0022273F01|nr:DUF86 domain-containing protein [Dethiobacter alkaliphilus]MCW3489646.1 DUF86 domain-containing protein [Dethiobacter alkaliphilus]